jgi:hypothetical protein
MTASIYSQGLRVGCLARFFRAGALRGGLMLTPI